MSDWKISSPPFRDAGIIMDDVPLMEAMPVEEAERRLNSFDRMLTDLKGVASYILSGIENGVSTTPGTDNTALTMILSTISKAHGYKS